jgi:hypothetical protein
MKMADFSEFFKDSLFSSIGRKCNIRTSIACEPGRNMSKKRNRPLGNAGGKLTPAVL